MSQGPQSELGKPSALINPAGDDKYDTDCVGHQYGLHICKNVILIVDVKEKIKEERNKINLLNWGGWVSSTPRQAL